MGLFFSPKHPFSLRPTASYYAKSGHSASKVIFAFFANRPLEKKTTVNLIIKQEKKRVLIRDYGRLMVTFT